MAVNRFILLATLLGLCLAKTRYDGYKVLHVVPKDDVQLRAVADMKRILREKVDFWTEPAQSGKSVDIMVGPDAMDSVLNMLARSGLDSTVMIEDVQQLADQTTIGQDGGIAALSDFRYDLYHTFSEIMTWVDDMTTEHPNLVSQHVIGSSLERRDLKVLQLGKPGFGKPIFWLQSGTHAREWLAPATVLRMVNMFVTEYNNGNAEIVNLLDKVDFHIMPISNPDGYVFSHTSDRLWRKTRGPTPYSWCVGVDPNRNWDDHWDHPNSDTYPCSQAYRGPSVFSEIEVKSVADHIMSLSNVKVFIDMHCYSQYWMVPYGWTYSLPPNYQEQKSLADKAMAALKAVNGLTFKTGSIANVIYIAPGSSLDWAYTKAGIPLAFAPELRDTGYYGFLMPSSYIKPSAEEVYEAIKVTADYIAA